MNDSFSLITFFLFITLFFALAVDEKEQKIQKLQSELDSLKTIYHIDTTKSHE